MYKIKHRGFTLIELLSVILIIGILSLIEYPNINKMVESQRLNGTVKVLINDLRYAKMYGVSKNVPSVFVRFNGDISRGEYTGYDVYQMKDLGVSSILKHVDFNRDIIVDGFDSTFSSASSENRIEFRSDGSVNPPCTIVVKDIDTNNKKYITLTIGYTRIMEVER